MAVVGLLDARDPDIPVHAHALAQAKFCQGDRIIGVELDCGRKGVQGAFDVSLEPVGLAERQESLA
jgi:hypothetical protein